MQLLITLVYIIALFLIALILFWFGFGVGYQYYKQRIFKSITQATENLTKETEARLASLRTTGQDVPDLSEVVNGVRYKTLDAKCIAQGGAEGYWTWLMQTNKDNFFLVVTNSLLKMTQIVPIEKELAMHIFSNAQRKDVQFKDAFPDVEIKDA